MFKLTPYANRRWLRWPEKVWSRLEHYLDRLTSAGYDNSGKRINFNPIYHLGTISIFLLLVLLVTGIYLTVVYRPGAVRAYQSMEAISAGWVGSLMRSVHRYASDGIVIIIFLHALKMLLSDRFWGSRWLAWVTGVLLVLILWVVGVMGYFLIWDQPAQWLVEYLTGFLKGPIPQTFSSPQAVSGAFGFFVIILFLHVFLSIVITLGVLIHELRIQRVHLWAPRWIMIGSIVILILFAIVWPVSSQQPADLTQIVESTRIDYGYLYFLPLTRQLGSGPFWTGLLVLISGITALPWLLKGRHPVGKAIVIEENCTGCTICAIECPYNAIDMINRPPDEKYKALAVVQTHLCVECGLCVGDCPTAAIELPNLTTHTIQDQLAQALTITHQDGNPPILVYSCERQLSMGTLVSDVLYPVVDAPVHRMIVDEIPVVICGLPCVGMIQSSWLRDGLAGGAQGVIIASCPHHDCAYLEGPDWLNQRLNRQRNQTQLAGRVRQIEVSPGVKRIFKHTLHQIADLTDSISRTLPRPLSLSFGATLLILLLATSLAMLWPGVAYTGDQGQLRITINHSAAVKTASTTVSGNVDERLPEGFTTEQVLGGERYPVRLRLEIDGMLVDEWLYDPTGLRDEGASYGLESLWLDPGTYQIRLEMMDDGDTWQEVFVGRLIVRADEVSILSYDNQQNVFKLTE